MDEQRLAEIEAKHSGARRLTDYGSGAVLDFCLECGNAFPCNSAVLMVEVRRLRSVVDRVALAYRMGDQARAALQRDDPKAHDLFEDAQDLWTEVEQSLGRAVVR